MKCSNIFLKICAEIVHPLKIFVHLPLIVRGKIRTVEGNLCLYLEVRNLDNLVMR